MDERTAVMNLPLPHPDHLLSDDVLRIRDALTALDAGFGQQRSEVQAELRQTRSALAVALSEVNAQLTDRLHRQHLRVFHHFNF